MKVSNLEPAFTAATGYPLVATGGPAVGLANQIRAGEISPDVYMSADAAAISGPEAAPGRVFSRRSTPTRAL